MVIGAIIVGIVIFALMLLGFYLREHGADFDTGVSTGVIIAILLVIEIGLVACIIEEPTPSALDVYRGNTELEITSVNGTPIDTVVVFKKN
jgi:hypothetical protein